MSMIPLAVPNVGTREAELVQQCFRDNWVSTVGPFVEQLEREIAALSGVEFGVAVAAGTMGLHASLVALGVGRGDLVILPAYTFIASANAIAHAGARPWLFDITRESWTLDPAAVAEALETRCHRDTDGSLRLTETGERVAAIMPVYTLGTPADMDALGEVARKHGLPIVADAAAALGARYKGRLIGPLADYTVYSFNGNKTITTGGGGMIVGPDGGKMKLAKHLTTTARVGTDYDHDRVGFNYRMTNVEAAIGCGQLERLPDFLAAKKRIRETYNRAFADLSLVECFPDVDWADSTYWFSGVIIREGKNISIDDLTASLTAAGIAGRKFWKPMNLQQPFADAPRHELSFTESLWTRVLTLPCSTSLTEEDQAKVIDILLPLLKPR